MIASLLAPVFFALAPSITANAPKRAPEFIGLAADWLNSSPLTVGGLRGKVVVVDFWEYTCVNCIRTFPYLKEWQRRYAKDGLVIVGIHSPEFPFAKDRGNVAQAVKGFGLQFPILIDSDYKNWDAYSNQYWPAKYLIDQDGNIVYSHFGEGEYGNFEQRIQDLLKVGHPGLELPKIMEPVRADDRPGAVCHPISAEMYGGLEGERLDQFSGGQLEADKRVDYPALANVQEGKFYLTGGWTARDHSYDAAGEASKLSIRYRAKSCNAVLKALAGPVEIEALQDGKPIARKDAGSDVRYVGGRSLVTVGAPRMYNLTTNAAWGEHRLTIVVRGAGFQLYSFAFTSDCETN